MDRRLGEEGSINRTPSSAPPQALPRRERGQGKRLAPRRAARPGAGVFLGGGFHGSARYGIRAGHAASTPSCSGCRIAPASR